MIKESVTIDEVIEIMNEAVARDRKAINALVNQRIECNTYLADHPTIQVRAGKAINGGAIYSVGLLGILNGLFGCDDISKYGAIAAVLDKDGILEKFTRAGFKTVKGEEL